MKPSKFHLRYDTRLLEFMTTQEATVFQILIDHEFGFTRWRTVNYMESFGVDVDSFLKAVGCKERIDFLHLVRGIYGHNRRYKKEWFYYLGDYDGFFYGISSDERELIEKIRQEYIQWWIDLGIIAVNPYESGPRQWWYTPRSEEELVKGVDDHTRRIRIKRFDEFKKHE